MKILRLSEVTSFPEPRELTPAELTEAYRLAREAFTAADLQTYTELDPGVPADAFLAELQAIQRQHHQKKLDDQSRGDSAVGRGLWGA